MIIVTKTFANLDYSLFLQYTDDARFLNLRMVSFRVADEKNLTLELSGNSDMIKTFTNWIGNPSNWAQQALSAS